MEENISEILLLVSGVTKPREPISMQVRLQLYIYFSLKIGMIFCFQRQSEWHGKGHRMPPLTRVPGVALRSLFVKTNWVCHVWCTIKPCYRCQTTLILGTLKDDSLLIHSLASNNYFSHRNALQNGVHTLSKMVSHFVKKLKILFSLDHLILLKFHQHVVQYLSNNVWRDFRLLMSASAMVT